MQNRRIIDSLFIKGEAGKPRVTVETDSVLALIAYVRSGGWSSVIPHTFLTLLGHQDAALKELRAIPLIEPNRSIRWGSWSVNVTLFHLWPAPC